MAPAPGLFCQEDLSKTKLRNTTHKEKHIRATSSHQHEWAEHLQLKTISLPSLRSWWGSVPWCPGKGEIHGLEFEHFLSAIYFFDA